MNISGGILMTYLRIVVPAFLALSFLIGCAAIKTEETVNTESLLSAAGFKMVPATTPKEKDMLSSLTPNKVQFSVKDNKPLYWYADPDNCGCVWTGDQDAYNRYERLLVESNIAEEQQETAEMMEEAEFAPGYWGWAGGPWGW